MKRIYAIILIIIPFCIEANAQCETILNDGIKEYNNAKGSMQKLNQLESFFIDLDANCKDEIGNRAALYAGRIRDLKAQIAYNQKQQELKRKIEAEKRAEEERLELERIQKEQEDRIAQNLICMEGYGHLKEGVDYPIVSLIKGELSHTYNYKYTTKPEKAVWVVYIAIDSRNVRKVGNSGNYKAYAVPMIVIKNIIEDEIVYEGSGLEFSDDYRGEDAKEANGNDEFAAIRSAFRKTIKPLSLTISNYITYEK